MRPYDKTKTITIIVPVKYPVGGIRTYMKYVYSKFDRNRYKFIIASQDYKRLKIIKEDLEGQHIEIKSSNFKNETLSLAVTVFKTILNNKEINLVHSQGYTAGIITCLINIIFRKPHIITLHHVFRAGQFSDTFWEKFPKIKRFIIELILKRANRIQPVSFDAKNNLISNFPGLKKIDKKIVAIQNGIDVENFINDDSSELEKKLPQNKFLIAFMGRFMPEKGFQYIIDVAEILSKKGNDKDFKIVVIGGFGGFIREYKKEISKRKLDDFFTFLGFTKNVHQLLKMVHLVLIPSLGEACPLVPMESLVSGTPVIAFACIGLREVLEETPGILVPVRDVETMVNEIIRVKKDYQNVKYIFKNFVPKAKKRYDSSITANKLQKLYNELLN